MLTYRTSMHWTPLAARLLMTDPERSEVLKARLPPHPSHPRALLTLLEGLALWTGAPVTAAISAAPSVDPRFVASLCGDSWPASSALVQFEDADETVLRRRRTLVGVGDFRQLRLLHARRA